MRRKFLRFPSPFLKSGICIVSIYYLGVFGDAYMILWANNVRIYVTVDIYLVTRSQYLGQSSATYLCNSWNLFP